MADVVIVADLCAFAEFETFDLTAVVTPVVIGVAHIEWGFSVFEGEAQGGDPPPPPPDVTVAPDLLAFAEFEALA